MKVHHNIGGWLTDKAVDGDKYLEAAGGKKVGNTWVGYGSHTAIYKTVSPDELKAESERSWRDSELSRTDKLVMLPDYPDDLLTYRAELRDYPAQTGFPNGTRPTL